MVEQRAMSRAHKQAMAQGRADGRVVKAYLEALAASRPKPGRKRNAAHVRARLKEIAEVFADAPPLTKLHLAQEQLDLEADIAGLDARKATATAERAFIKVAKRYSERKGISYAAWRAAGVSPTTLRTAGIIS